MSAVRAEIVKLTRQRGALFWGFLLVPAFTTFFSLLLVGSGPPPGAGIGAGTAAGAVNAIQPFHSAARALNVGGNPIAQLFFAIGAAAIFVVDYRYSGWRHLVPRASRARLLFAKFVTFALFAGGSLMLVAIGDAVVSFGAPLARPMKWVVADPGQGGIVLLSFLISWLGLVAFGALVAAVVVATRSATGAIVAPFLLSLAATMAESWLAGQGGAPIPLPTFAGDSLRAWLAGSASAGAAQAGLATLVAWAAASGAIAAAIFIRQDLVGE
jgi:hypothetical protein